MKLKVCQAIWMPNEWWSKDGIILCRGPSDWPAVLAGIRSHSDMSVCLPPQRSVVGCVHAGFFLSNLVLLSSHLQFAGIFSCEFGVFLHIAIWCYLFDPGRGQGQVGNPDFGRSIRGSIEVEFAIEAPFDSISSRCLRLTCFSTDSYSPFIVFLSISHIFFELFLPNFCKLLLKFSKHRLISFRNFPELLGKPR